MPNHSRNPKRPRDVNQLAKAIVDMATMGSELLPETKAQAEAVPDPIREAAKELGRRGGLKGGLARPKKLTAEERSEVDRKAAKARWDSSKS
jgi:hypothetical protein